MRERIIDFLPTWDAWMVYGFALFAAISLVIYLYLKIRMGTIKGMKAKYDFTSNYEIKLIQASVTSLVIGITLILNTVATEFVTENPTMFFFRLFITGALGMILGFTMAKYVEFNWPDRLEKKLQKFRYTPRISPKSGKPMKLLSEEEEDVHLSEGQIAEENVYSVDYDVWLDEETGFTQVEKYLGRSHSEECPSCHYRTMRIQNEEVLEPPSTSEEGRLMKHLKCDVCGYRIKKEFKVAKIAPHEANIPAGK